MTTDAEPLRTAVRLWSMADTTRLNSNWICFIVETVGYNNDSSSRVYCEIVGARGDCIMQFTVIAVVSISGSYRAQQ